MPALIVASGTQRGVFLNLGRKTTVVGRDEAVPLQLEDDRVSRKHAQFRFECSDNSYRLLDMSSRNGTLVNNKPIALEAIFKDGDEVTVGDTILLFTSQIPESQPNALELLKKVGERRRDTLTLSLVGKVQPNEMPTIRPYGWRDANVNFAICVDVQRANRRMLSELNLERRSAAVTCADDFLERGTS